MPVDAEMDRTYELTTSLSFPLMSVDALTELAARLDAAIFEVTGAYPTITAYFVSTEDETSEISIGLRFEGMPPENIEGTATDVVHEAMQAANEGRPLPSAVREESTLIPA